MKGKGSYVPPLYIPLGQSDASIEELDSPSSDEDLSTSQGPIAGDPMQWSSGICACFDDMQSCCMGTVCPCYLFGKNAEYLGSGTLAGSCMTHFILWSILNCLCCVFSGGILSLIPGSTVACYTCGYRKALRAKFNIQEAPCGDLTTHVFCHLCANCQEYREIHGRSNGPTSELALAAITAPSMQTMEGNNKVETG